MGNGSCSKRGRVGRAPMRAGTTAIERERADDELVAAANSSVPDGASSVAGSGADCRNGQEREGSAPLCRSLRQVAAAQSSGSAGASRERRTRWYRLDMLLVDILVRTDSGQRVRPLLGTLVSEHTALVVHSVVGVEQFEDLAVELLRAAVPAAHRECSALEEADVSPVGVIVGHGREFYTTRFQRVAAELGVEVRHWPADRPGLPPRSARVSGPGRG